MSRRGALAPSPVAENVEFEEASEPVGAQLGLDALGPEVERSVRSLIDRHELATGTQVPRSIAVVAALEGDGATTVARGLARVLATDFGSSVCLLDLGDTGALPASAPFSSDGPDSQGEEGLYELLEETGRIDALLRRTDHPAVSRLPAGNVPSSERYAIARRSKFELLMKRLRRDFGFVVLDAPPVRPVSNALALLRHADAHVLVIRSGRTTAGQVRELADEVSSVPCLGAVLNAHRTSTPAVIRRILEG